MNLVDALSEIENCYKRMKMCGSTQGRKYNANKILLIMNQCPKVLDYWYYNPEQFCIVDRFGRIKPKQSTQTKITIINHIVCDPTYRTRTAPTEEGVYFIGNTAFNPYTNEKQYWVKVGMTYSGIKKRLRNYDTHSPSTYHIDYFPCKDAGVKEGEYHNLLAKVSLGLSERNTEWWLVDEVTYLKMCALGFEYFNTI